MTVRRINSIAMGCFFYLLLFILAPLPQSGATPGPAVGLIESILTTPESEIDLAETLLAVSVHRNPSLDTEPLRKELDRLTDLARKSLRGNPPAESTIAILRHIIHQEGGYRYTERLDEQGIPLDSAELFLHGLLKNRRGYCMNLSLLYLIIAERLNLPLHGVALPNHFFVRFDDGQQSINIETTEGGARYPDDFYRSRFGVPESSVFFMRNLGKKQTLGAYFSNVGMVHYKDGNPETALIYLKITAAINSNSIEAQNNLANIYSEQNQPDLAIQHYLQALAANNNDLSTLYNLGLAYKQARKPGKAIDTFLQAVQIDPFFIPGHQALVNLYMDRRKYFGALLHLKQLAKIDPSNLQIQIGLGSAYLGINQPRLALAVIQALLARHPNHPRVLESLAETQYRLKAFDRAVEIYRKLVEYEPENLKAHIQLGWTLYRIDKIEPAIAWTRRGLKNTNPANPLRNLAHMNLGLYHVLAKNYSEAKSRYLKAFGSKETTVITGTIEDLQEAAKNHPDRSDLDFFVGWIYFQNQAKPKSEHHLRRYLYRQPEGELAQEARQLLQTLSAEGKPRSGFLSPIQLPVPEGMVFVPSGSFTMGSNVKGADERPEHPVHLDDFYIDAHEISSADFASFLNEAGNQKGYYLDNKYGTLLYNGRFQSREGLQSLPINNVNWYGARAYCEWKNKRLPKETEWEKAARGTDKRLHPWGNERPSPSRARYFQSWTEEMKHHVMLPVDSLPEGKSPYGVHHMAGNVKEWVDDWYDREYYSDLPGETDPEGPIGGEFKGVRGGSWRDMSGFIYSSFRNNSYPETRLEDYGFRCAKNAGKKSATKKLIQWQKPPDIRAFELTDQGRI